MRQRLLFLSADTPLTLNSKFGALRGCRQRFFQLARREDNRRAALISFNVFII